MKVSLVSTSYLTLSISFKLTPVYSFSISQSFLHQRKGMVCQVNLNLPSVMHAENFSQKGTSVTWSSWKKWQKEEAFLKHKKYSITQLVTGYPILIMGGLRNWQLVGTRILSIKMESTIIYGTILSEYPLHRATLFHVGKTIFSIAINLESTCS